MVAKQNDMFVFIDLVINHILQDYRRLCARLFTLLSEKKDQTVLLTD